MDKREIKLYKNAEFFIRKLFGEDLEFRGQAGFLERTLSVAYLFETAIMEKEYLF